MNTFDLKLFFPEETLQLIIRVFKIIKTQRKNTILNVNFHDN